MSYNLNDIRNELKVNIEAQFTNSKKPSNAELGISFDLGVDLFLKAVVFNCGVHDLDGLTRTLIPTLYDSYVSKRGDLTSLRLLLTELEAYLKKIAFIISSGTDNFASDKSKTLVPLYNHLRLLPSDILAKDLNDLSLEKGGDYFFEHLCRSYLARNAVHKSPNWNLREVSTILESVLVVYLYSTFKHNKKLEAAVGQIKLPVSSTETTTNSKDPGTRALFDLISYNDGTNQIRSQIVTSYLLHLLSSDDKPCSLKYLQAACNKQFQANAELTFYKNIVQGLAKPGVGKLILESGIGVDQVSLSPDERRRIDKLKDNMHFQEEMFDLELSEALKLYSLEAKLKEFKVLLIELFENNYNLDLKEMLDEGSEAKDNIQSLKECLTQLTRIGVSEEIKVEALRSLLRVCEGNDFISRVTAGKVFASMNNLPLIQEYINQETRYVYLDTNVLLHAMCFYYEDCAEYASLPYQCTRELLRYAEAHQNMQLRTTKAYINEVAYHLREALLLIPLERLGLFKFSGSYNVFYKFYSSLHVEGLLDEDVDSFADFMNNLGLSEDNLDDASFFNVTGEIIIDALGRLDIDVVELPTYEITDAFEIVKNSVTLSGKFKDPIPMKNDTLMVCHLGDKAFHVVEPSFVTWDGSFYDIRKKYLNKYKNSGKWHLFTPSRFLNHFQLLEFKIDSTSIANDFLNIIDGIDLPERTRNLLDTVSLLLDIQKEERRRYVTKFTEFMNNNVLNLDMTPGAEALGVEKFRPLEKIIMELFNYYSGNKQKYKFNELKKVFADKGCFEDVIALFKAALEYYGKHHSIPPDIFEKFDSLIERVIGNKK